MSSYNHDEFEEVESPFAQHTRVRPKTIKTSADTLFDDELVIEDRPLETPISYLPTSSKPRATTRKKSRVGIGKKIGWSLIGLLTLRLIFMDRGIVDYHGMRSRIADKRHELELIRKENKEISKEIQLIQFDKGYQKQIAKEHLGVIAADEFLILFGSERPQISKSVGH